MSFPANLFKLALFKLTNKQLFVELSNNVICENAVIIFVFGWEETNEDNTH
jgi:hypothetical protein